MKKHSDTSTTTSNNISLMLNRAGDSFLCVCQLILFNFLNDSLFPDLAEAKKEMFKASGVVQNYSPPALSGEIVQSNEVVPVQNN